MKLRKYKPNIYLKIFQASPSISNGRPLTVCNTCKKSHSFLKGKRNGSNRKPWFSESCKVLRNIVNIK